MATMADFDEREHAFSYYDSVKISRRKSEPLIEAFLAKGFVLRDIGGGDLVWTAAFGIKDEITLVVEVLGMSRHQERGSQLWWQVVASLSEDVNVNVGNGETGVYMGAGTARRFLESFGTYNLAPMNI